MKKAVKLEPFCASLSRIIENPLKIAGLSPCVQREQGSGHALVLAVSGFLRLIARGFHPSRFAFCLSRPWERHFLPRSGFRFMSRLVFNVPNRLGGSSSGVNNDSAGSGNVSVSVVGGSEGISASGSCHEVCGSDTGAVNSVVSVGMESSAGCSWPGRGNLSAGKMRKMPWRFLSTRSNPSLLN